MTKEAYIEMVKDIVNNNAEYEYKPSKEFFVEETGPGMTLT